jgi:hypothetical protein
MGVVLFDLIPEAISLTGVRFDVPVTTAVLAAGFLAYMVLDRAIVLTSKDKENHPRALGSLPPLGSSTAYGIASKLSKNKS